MIIESQGWKAASTDRYDRLTRIFHWLTAAVVIFMFATPHIWQNLEKGPLRKGLESVHISMGIFLAVLIAARILWRVSGGLWLAPVSKQKAANLVAKLAHLSLYGLLLAQVVLGFMFRWSQGEPFSFFGLITMPEPFIVSPELRHTLAGLHNNVAWAIIILSGLHACVALTHHYLLRDGTLQRMLPASRKDLQGR